MEKESDFNFIYEKIVDEPSNIVGLVAYGIYKRHKVEFIRNYIDEHGKSPSRDDLAHFHEVSCGHINGYTLEAIELFSDFANSLLEERLEELDKEKQIEIAKIKEEYHNKLEQNLKNNSLEVGVIIQKHSGWLKKSIIRHSGHFYRNSSKFYVLIRTFIKSKVICRHMELYYLTFILTTTLFMLTFFSRCFENTIQADTPTRKHGFFYALIQE